MQLKMQPHKLKYKGDMFKVKIRHRLLRSNFSRRYSEITHRLLCEMRKRSSWHKFLILSLAQKSISYIFIIFLEFFLWEFRPIKAGKNWIAQHLNHAPSIIEHIKARMGELTDNQKKIHIVYLLNDVLYNCTKVEEEKRMITDSFAPRLGMILNIAYLLNTGPKWRFNWFIVRYQAPDLREKIEKVIAIWVKRGIFDEATLKRIEEEMRDETLLPRLRSDQLQRHNEILRHQREQQIMQQSQV